MKLSQIELYLENIAKDSKVRLLNVRPSYEYKDGVKSDVVSGQAYECFLENNGFEKVVVRTIENEAIISQESLNVSKEPVYVQFKDFVGRLYFSNQTKGWELSLKASAAILIKPKQQQ